MVLEVRQGPVEAVRRVRAAHTARLRPAVDRRAEHEVVDEQLRAPVEELGEGLRAFVGLEAVVLVDTHPRKVSPLARQLVTAARERLLALEQLLARRKPVLTGSDPAIRHL